MPKYKKLGLHNVPASPAIAKPIKPAPAPPVKFVFDQDKRKAKKQAVTKWNWDKK